MEWRCRGVPKSFIYYCTNHWLIPVQIQEAVHLYEYGHGSTVSEYLALLNKPGAERFFFQLVPSGQFQQGPTLTGRIIASGTPMYSIRCYPVLLQILVATGHV